MQKLEPGMSIFLGTGVGEPRTLVKHLVKRFANIISNPPKLQLRLQFK